MKQTIKDQILEVAYKLFLTKGYNQTSVQNIIDDVQIAKGTFYHYFNSKTELLDELTNNLVEKEAKIIFDEIKKSKGSAIDQLNQFFQMQQKWKIDQIQFLLIVLEVMYSDENVLFLKKLNEKMIIYYEPILTKIIKQGVEEKYFTTPDPDALGEIIVRFSNSFSEIIAKILLNINQYDHPIDVLKLKVDFYLDCFERLLGLKHGKLEIIDYQVMKEIIFRLKG